MSRVRKRKGKWGRNRSSGRAGTVILRKDKARNKHTKFVMVNNELIPKPQWRGEQRKDGTFEVLETSNQDNLIKRDDHGRKR